MAWFVVDYTPHLLERDRKIPGDARHHRVGVSLCDHRGAKIVAVLIDEALAISKKVAFALQPFVQKLRVERVALGKPCVMNLDALVREVEALTPLRPPERVPRARPGSQCRAPE